MKKVGVLVVGFMLVFGFFARDLKAQQEMDLYLNLGVLTDDSFDFDPFTWSAGVNLDVHFTDKLMLSPECDVIFQEFKFDYIWLAPGILANVKLSSFFVGAGISKWFKLSGEFATNSKLLLKINAGFKGKKYRVAAYVATPFSDLFEKYMVTFGAVLGFGF